MAFDLSHYTQKFIHSYLVKGELCDPPLTSALTDFLQPGDTFIDVGSHVGYYSLLALQMVGETGHVFTFEANPETFGVLIATAQANKAANFFPYNCAIGDREGTASFSINDTDEGMSSMAVPYDRAISVFVTTLDALHQRLGFEQVRMVKIDVEGFERAVIEGGREFFTKAAPESVVFEVNNNIPGVAKFQDLGIRAYFAELGYRSYLIRPWHLDPAGERLYGNSNFLELPKGYQLDIPYGNILATRRPIEAPSF